jgi:hypothetical protein
LDEHIEGDCIVHPYFEKLSRRFITRNAPEMRPFLENLDARHRLLNQPGHNRASTAHAFLDKIENPFDRLLQSG